MLLLNWCCCYTDVAAKLVLLLNWCCWCTIAAAYWCCCCIDADSMVHRCIGVDAPLLISRAECFPFRYFFTQLIFFIFLLLIQTCNILPISYILIICSLHLHKFSYDSQIHNILTCVNTLHFSESIFFFILCV